MSVFNPILRTIRLDRETSTNVIRETLNEYKLSGNPNYCGHGIEVYERPDRKLAMIVDWDVRTIRIKHLEPYGE